MMQAISAIQEVDSATQAMTELSWTSMEEDIVLVWGLDIQTVVGAYEEERESAQTLRFDISIGAEHLRACVTDRLADTIDYVAVAATVRDVCADHTNHLLEALAEEIAGEILDRFDARWVRLTVCKRAIISDTRLAGISIKRSRRLGAVGPTAFAVTRQVR